MARAIPEMHQKMLHRIIGVLEKDDRFEAILGGGSMVQGGFDEYSDLDLIVVITSDAYDTVMAERHAIADKIGGLLGAFSGEHVGEPRLLICLFGLPLIHVDLKFIMPSDLDELVELPHIAWARTNSEVARRLVLAQIQWPQRSPQWFEDRAWIWLHYGATKALRGELFEAIGMLAFFREQVLGPLLHRSESRPQRGVRRLDVHEEARLALAKTVATYGAASVFQALKESIELYIKLRREVPPPLPTKHMPGALLDYIGHT